MPVEGIQYSVLTPVPIRDGEKMYLVFKKEGDAFPIFFEFSKDLFPYLKTHDSLPPAIMLYPKSEFYLDIEEVKK